jgi:glucosamine kinase
VAFFLGIDGGGSQTRCVVGDENSVLGAGSSASCKVQRVGEACARDSLAAAIHEACVHARISPREIARTCAGVTGSARHGIANIMHELISSIVAGEIGVVGDVEIAFEDAFGDEPGLLVIAGTGSIAYGRNAQGATARAGGWGHAISDEGSGYWIGIEGVRAALQARDRGEDSALLSELMDKIGATDVNDFIVMINANPAPDFAAFFPAILAAGDGGDALATKVLEQSGIELAKLAQIVIGRLFASSFVNSDEIQLATHGGVLASSAQVRGSLAANIACRNPYVVLSSQPVDPARGALNRARGGFLAAAISP